MTHKKSEQVYCWRSLQLKLSPLFSLPPLINLPEAWSLCTFSPADAANLAHAGATELSCTSAHEHKRHTILTTPHFLFGVWSLCHSPSSSLKSSRSRIARGTCFAGRRCSFRTQLFPSLTTRTHRPHEQRSSCVPVHVEQQAESGILITL